MGLSRREVQDSTCPLLCRVSTGKNKKTRWVFCESPSNGLLPAGVALYHDADFGDFLVATRSFKKGEVVFDERPLLEADIAASNTEWAIPSLEAFCHAPSRTQSSVLTMFHSGDTSHSPRMASDVANQVARCTNTPWRAGVSDETLSATCYVFNLNAYPSGPQDGRNALYWVGAKIAHSCVANVVYTWVADDGANAVASGSGRFFAQQNISEGEMLSTNYLGDMAKYMSTPARREMLRDTKLFICYCPRCADLGEDLARRVPCPRCHPRGPDGLLPGPMAFPSRTEGRVLSDGTVFKVHYVTPRRAAAEPNAPHMWGPCASCSKAFSDDSYLPGGGRSSERQVEAYVHGLLAQLLMVRGRGAREIVHLRESDDLAQKIKALQQLVAKRVGAMHWTSVRIRALMNLFGLASA